MKTSEMSTCRTEYRRNEYIRKDKFIHIKRKTRCTSHKDRKGEMRNSSDNPKGRNHMEFTLLNGIFRKERVSMWVGFSCLRIQGPLERSCGHGMNFRVP